MDFIDRVKELSARAQEQLPQITTEEATKTALVMPFIQALGYNVFDVSEVVPEYTADLGIKKGEKIDYAILRDGEPVIFIEAKSARAPLGDPHHSQLHRYFGTTPSARFAVLTNGTEYRFYSDLDRPNILDSRPFLIFDLLDVKERLVEELKKFTKAAFDVEEILSTAATLKYVTELKRYITTQLREPDEDFIRFFTNQVYDGRITQNIRDQFSAIVIQAFKQYINDRMSERLQSALYESSKVGAAAETDAENDEEDEDDGEEAGDEKPRVVTTAEEMEGYFIVRAILRQSMDVSRVFMRDTKSYCGIILDDSNRKPICRLRFNRSQKYIGLFDADKNETKHPIDSLDEIYGFAEELKAAVGYYEEADA